VVFYTPWIGSILSSRNATPAGGAETQVMLLAKALARRGLRVAIVAFGDAADLPGEVDGVVVIPRPRYRRPRGILDKGHDVFRIWQSLYRAPSRTVVYRSGGYEMALVGIYARLAGRRFVFASASIIDFDYDKVDARHAYQLLYRFGVWLADAIVVQTEEQAELCMQAFARPPTLIKSIAAPGSLQHAVPTAFVWVGRLVSYKRPLDYVALARAVPEAQFWMVGVPARRTHGTEHEVARDVALQARGVPNLELLPPRPHSEIGALMARAVASVNTAEFEGMPNVLLEAWSCGVPALVLHHDPGRVVETHQLGGFASGSPDRLVELAREQWAHRASRAPLSQRCRRYVTTYHSPEVVVEQWLRVLARSMAEEPATIVARQRCAA
jgi:glycosyltransferase involved in cell wall biosynthesis